MKFQLLAKTRVSSDKLYADFLYCEIRLIRMDDHEAICFSFLTKKHSKTFAEQNITWLFSSSMENKASFAPFCL